MAERVTMNSATSVTPMAEVIGILLIFSAAGAWPVPDVNEAHYLTKARHAFDPSWAAGDFFLESRAAHGVFYALFGPLASLLPLESAAWVGRVIGWLCLAIGFRHAARPLLADPLWRVLAAGVFSLSLRHTTAAGEWVIGGCEAKVFAWSAVLVAIGEGLAGRWARAWCWAGVGTAIHPLVGGWAMVAIAASAWRSGLARPFCMPPVRVRADHKNVRVSSRRAAADSSGSQPAVASDHFWTWSFRVAPCLIAGGVLAAGGVVPAILLSADATAAERQAAALVYVTERLPHHLLPQSFSEGCIDRHVMGILLWWAAAQLLPRGDSRLRLGRLTWAAVGISVVGCGIASLESHSPAQAAEWLRYYWFRLADGIVPLAHALTLTAVAARWWTAMPTGSGGGRSVGIESRWPAALLVVAVTADLAGESRHWPLPGRHLAARADAKVDEEAWEEICRWVRTHAPVEATFLTPRGAATFTWRTARSEVVSWKNIPQDARAILEWRRRIIDCFSGDGSLRSMARSTAALGGDRLHEVALRYGAGYAIIPLADVLELNDAAGIIEVHRNSGYAVYAIEARPSAEH
jgi:hypothetical protein